MRLRERGKRVRIRSQAVSSRLVPVLEPTSHFFLPSRVAAQVRPKRRMRCAYPIWSWLWRNAEPLLWGAVVSALTLSLWFSPRTQLARLEVVGAPNHYAAHALRQDSDRKRRATVRRPHRSFVPPAES